MKRNSEINNILHNGSVIKTKYYNFYFTKSSCNDVGRTYVCEGNRLAIVIKKKVGVAVVRNYEKRLLRQFFRYTEIEPEVDIVVYVKRVGGDFEEKKEIFCQAMSSINEM